MLESLNILMTKEEENLKSIYLHDNKLEGEIPKFFQENITHVTLMNNEFKEI